MYNKSCICDLNVVDRNEKNNYYYILCVHML